MFDIQKESTVDRELRILSLWEKASTFKKSLQRREGGKHFTFYDGPPFATGLPHYGHLLAGTIKDVVPRYKTMKGFYVDRRFGWDCHGLPVENEIEKANEMSGASAIEKYGIANFNEECRSIVLRYTEEWKKTVNRLGRWVDFDRTYKTMDPTFMESVWWVFKEIWDKGLVYQGHKVMPFSFQLGTPLSNFEANLNYKFVDDPSLVVKMRSAEEENLSYLIWTTTPWTLTSNAALVVSPDLDYVRLCVKSSGEEYVLGKSRVSHHFKDLEDIDIISEFKGGQLEGRGYIPPFDFFNEEMGENAHRIYLDGFVTDDSGTGVVHAAPAFGEMDFFVCQREQVEIVCPIDQNGRFTDQVPPFEGRFVKDCDKEIARELKDRGLLFSQGTVRHSYPFCWRSDTPLLYKAVSTWFVSVEKIKDRLLAANETIQWVPENIKHGRFGNWLENARDWAVSRNRYWGTPIPIWMNDDGHAIVIGSIKELKERTGKEITDLHRHHIDELTFEEGGKIYRRVTEVFDCWFESGSMPYAQNHYPFENREYTEQNFPADFIAEGLDQTRGWFYTLTVLASALFDKPPFRNVIVNGIVLAEDGTKMSKRLKNYPDPEEVFGTLGADGVRLYLLSSPVVEGDDFNFSKKGVELTLRQVLIPLWNSYVFLATYAKIYNFSPKHSVEVGPSADIDRWILSKLQKLILDVEEGMESYHLNRAVHPFVQFIDDMTNWYIRRSRARFWSDVKSQDRQEAFTTLYRVLQTLVQITAPFVPFISEAIYQELKEETDLESVHLCDFPVYDPTIRDVALEMEMEEILKIVSMGHRLRKEHSVKVRQPLSKAIVICKDQDVLASLKRYEELICDELNIKTLTFTEDEEQFVSLSLKPNFRTLGKRVGPLMSGAKKAIESLSQEEIAKFSDAGAYTICVQDEEIELGLEDVVIERVVKDNLVAEVSGSVGVALDLVLSEDLLLEGLAREIVNKVNTMRRDRGLHVSDRIHLSLDLTDRARKAFSLWESYITQEVLASKVDFVALDCEHLDLNGEEVRIEIAKKA